MGWGTTRSAFKKSHIVTATRHHLRLIRNGYHKQSEQCYNLPDQRFE